MHSFGWKYPFVLDGHLNGKMLSMSEKKEVDPRDTLLLSIELLQDSQGLREAGQTFPSNMARLKASRTEPPT